MAIPHRQYGQCGIIERLAYRTLRSSMTFTPEKIEWLRQDLNRDLVSLREESRDSFLYLAGNVSINQLNELSDFTFSSAVQSVTVVNRFETEKDVWENGQKTGAKTKDFRTLYQAIVSVTVNGVTKTDVGTGLTANDKPESHEMAIKGAATDALKRAARQFGNQFGNSLYEKDSADNAEMKVEKSSKRRAPAARPAAPRPAASAPKTPPVQCEGCPKKLEGYASKRDQGKFINSEQQAEMSRKRFDGKVYCPDCYQKALTPAT
jgi:DNA repair and recombination protein RAD52